MSKRDYYQVLGVDRSASGDDIKRAFRRLARDLHPDVNAHDPEAEEKFKEAAEAYEVLSDPPRRETYDAFGHKGLRFDGFEPSSAPGSLQDIFDAIFGGSDPFSNLRRAPSAGAEPIVPECVVGATAVGVGQHLVGLRGLLELLLGLRVVPVDVRMELPGKPPEGLLDLGVSGAALDAEDLVVVPLHRGHDRLVR